MPSDNFVAVPDFNGREAQDETTVLGKVFPTILLPSQARQQEQILIFLD